MHTRCAKCHTRFNWCCGTVDPMHGTADCGRRRRSGGGGVPVGGGGAAGGRPFGPIDYASYSPIFYGFTAAEQRAREMRTEAHARYPGGGSSGGGGGARPSPAEQRARELQIAQDEALARLLSGGSFFPGGAPGGAFGHRPPGAPRATPPGAQPSPSSRALYAPPTGAPGGTTWLLGMGLGPGRARDRASPLYDSDSDA